MAEVTVSDLAKSVGASVDRLLNQMKEAGLPQTSADDVVSNEEKKTLLVFLKASHGEESDAPRKITLKRKTTSTLKVGSGSSKKTVNVEVRKKRTYVKRNVDAEPEAPEAEIEPAVEEVAEVPTAPVVEETSAPVEEVSEKTEDAQTTEDKSAPKAQKTVRVDDIEEKRLAAIEARRKQEQEEKEKQAALLEARKKAEEEKAAARNKKSAEPASATPPAESEERGKHSKKKEKHHHEDSEDEPRKSKNHPSWSWSQESRP